MKTNYPIPAPRSLPPRQQASRALGLLSAVLLIALLCSSPRAFAADDDAASPDTSITLQLLKAPSSPAFTLLGLDPSNVDRPINPTDLAIYFAQKTNSLSSLPTENVAVEFSPGILLFGSDFSFTDFYRPSACRDPLKVLGQTGLISVATSKLAADDSDPDTTLLAWGLRFSVLQGRIDTKAKLSEADLLLYDSLENLSRAYANSVLVLTDSLAKQDGLYKFYLNELKRCMLTQPDSADYCEQRYKNRYDDLIHAADSTVLQRSVGRLYSVAQKIKSTYTQFRFQRTGLNWDFAGGAAYAFPGDTVQNGKVDHWGIWTTFGYEGILATGGGALSILGTARYLESGANTDERSLDGGARFVFDGKKNISASGEMIQRYFPKRIGRRWEKRVALNIDYTVLPNKVLSFTFGRDFEGKKSGNLIAMANLILGFGASRPVPK